MRLMYSIVAAELQWKARKIDQKSRTMTFVENYFLIEAYAMDMTDKLAIVNFIYVFDFIYFFDFVYVLD